MKRNGFTLIELMVAVALIGIVMAIVIPFLVPRPSRPAPVMAPGQPAINSNAPHGFAEPKEVEGVRNVYEFKLSNGTPCVIYYGHNVTCKW